MIIGGCHGKIKLKQKKSCKVLYSTIKLSDVGVIESPFPMQGMDLLHRPFIIPLKPQCNKNWVRLRVSLLPMQSGSTRRKKHKSFFYKFKNNFLKKTLKRTQKKGPPKSLG